MTQRWDVDDFVSLPRWKIRWNASPVDVSDDSDDSESCLITMQEVSSLSHTVQASDGRTYDALGLQEWLRRAPESSVIPGCPITYVDLVPFHRALARRTRAAWSRLARRVTLAWHLSRFKKKVVRRQDPMWKRVLEVNRRAKIRAPRKSAPLLPHPHSAFSPVISPR